MTYLCMKHVLLALALLSSSSIAATAPADDSFSMPLPPGQVELQYFEVFYAPTVIGFPGPDGGQTSLELVASNVNAPTTKAIVVTVALFPITKQCSWAGKKRCDWTKLGLGQKEPSSDGSTKNEIKFCDDEGRLIIDRDKIEASGFLIDYEIPVGTTKKEFVTIMEPSGDAAEVDVNGPYVALFANCDNSIAASNTDISIRGQAGWATEHHYLPPYLKKSELLHSIFMVLYFGLFIWFANCMRIHKASRIALEKWVLLTVTFSFVYELALTIKLVLLDWTGFSNLSSFFAFTTFAKSGSSLCLILALSMGWGITRDSLGWGICCPLSVLLALWMATSISVALINAQVVSSYWWEMDMRWNLIKSRMIFESIFQVWILVALVRTIRFLRRTNQDTKLSRFLKLRWLFVLGTLWRLFYNGFLYVFNTFMMKSGYTDSYTWVYIILTISDRVIDYVVILGVAILWRPSPNAHEYAFATELATSDTEDENVNNIDTSSAIELGTHDGELT